MTPEVEKLIEAAKSIIKNPWQSYLEKQDLNVLIVSGFQIAALKQAIEEFEKCVKS